VSRRGTARRIATNIWEDDKRRIGIAKVGRFRKTKRFPKSTTERTITAWIEKTRTTLRTQRAVVIRQRGTLTGDARAYLALLPTGRAKNNTTANLNAWIRALGEVQTLRLTDAQLQHVLNDWQAAGAAASTLKHRRRDLAQLIARLYPDAANPARLVKVPSEPESAPRGADLHVLTAILDGMDRTRGSRHPGRGGRGFRNKAQA
jgi:hypothetical protein